MAVDNQRAPFVFCVNEALLEYDDWPSVSDDAAAIVAGSPRLNVAPRTLVHIDRHPDLGEFRITVSGGTESGASYTTDKDDAIRTARNKAGAHCVIEHRTLRYRRGRAAAPAGRALPRRRDIPTSTT